MKKTLSIITVICLLASLLSVFGCVDASAATEEVSLYSTRVIAQGYGVTQEAIYIKTNVNADDEHVYLHREFGEEWKDFEATYKTTLNDGSKIWVVNVLTSGNAFEYAIKYVADGVEYWDNNNGQNYTNEKLGCANVDVNTIGNYFCSNYADINATVKNLAYNKNVVVRYTTDNWASYTDAPMSFQKTNTDGTENWKIHLNNISIGEGFQFCIYYEVNGQTYWGNNFEANYTTYEIVHH